MKGRIIRHNITALVNRCLWLLLLTPSSAIAQNNIGGVINSYYKITALSTIQSSMDMVSTTGLSLYDNVMIIQMKGAGVNTSNSNLFGNITSYNDAGNYEINTICGIEPTRVYLLNKISRTYDPANGFVQLVRIPSYANATVIAPLQPQPWDKTTGTGGVLALMVNGTLTLQSNISVTDNGFKGGDFKQLTGACTNFFFYTNYFYNTAAVSNGGDYKGEGIAELSNTYSGGMGASANAGGGGNDHNTGGGGGANLAAGGDGGHNTSTVGCRGDYPGVGAYGLNNTGNKIFMGGGGGTGHDDGTDVTTGGGNGAGIVFIKATELTGNGYTIAANGSKGTSTVGDGASGGGAGGTIIMDVFTYTGPVNIEVKGGDGGDEDNFSIAGRCYGTGGGGAGGVIYYTGALPPTASNNITAGAAGIAFNSSPVSCNGVTGATAGANGTTAGSYTVSVSNTPETFCNTLLSSKYVALAVNKNNAGNNLLKWKIQGVDNADYFMIEKSGESLVWKETGRSNYQQALTTYQFKDEAVNNGPVYYRISAVFPSGMNYYSNVVYVKNSSNSKWLIVGNPVKDYLYINGLPPEATGIFLYDATGKLIKQFTSAAFTQPAQLNVSNLSKGIYYVRCNGVLKGFLKE